MSGIAAAVLIDEVVPGVRDGLFNDPEAVSRAAVAVDVPETEAG